MGQPLGLVTLFFTEMWERFSYYGMRAILILFMTTPAAQEGLGLDVETSAAVYGLYTAGVYLLTLPGGWLADNVFGQQKSIWYGGIIIMLGHAILAIPGSNEIFFTGLCFVAAGSGMLKPNISSIVGDLYPEGGARRDAGFSIFYMGINIGSLLGQVIIAYLGERVNWHYGFGAAAIGMFIGLLVFRMSIGTLGDIGTRPKAKTAQSLNGNGIRNYKTPALLLVVALVLIIVLQLLAVIDLTTARGLAEGLGVLIIIITLAFFGNILLAGGLTVEEKKNVVVIFILFIGAALFWSGFEQAGSSLNLFARDYTDRMLFGFEIPTGWLQAVNPIFIIILAPMMGALWVKLAARQLNPSTPVKFGFGLILMGVGFWVMYLAAQLVVAGNTPGMGWLVATYFFHSVGELTLSPVGLSATTKLAPRRYYSQMMGVWFVGAALGNLIAGLFAGGFDPSQTAQMPDLFFSVVTFAVGSGILFIVFSGLMRKWMTGTD